MAATRRRCRFAAVVAVSAAAAAVGLAASSAAAPPSTGAAVAVAATAAAAAAGAPPPSLAAAASVLPSTAHQDATTAAATPPAGLYFMVDGELRSSLDPRALVHSFGSATDALTVVFVPSAAGESITATHFSGLDAGVCTGAAAAVAPLTSADESTGGSAAAGAGMPGGAANVTLTMEFDGRVGVTPFEFSVDTVDVAGGAHTYRCGGSYVVCGLSLVDDATGAVVSGDGGGDGVSLGTYADVLAAGTFRLGVRAQACDAAASGGGGGTPSLDGVQVSVRDVAGDEDLGVFPQPNGCPAVADTVADGCSYAFTADGSGLLLRPAAYRVGAGGVVASLVWPAAAVDGEVWEADVAVRLATTPPPPPVVTGLLADMDAAPLDVYGGELVGLSAFNAPVYGGDVGACGWTVAGATSPLVREACTFGAADQELVFRTAGGPAFSVHNDSAVVCDGVTAVQSADVAPGGGAAGLRVAFGDGRLATTAVANGTDFVAAATAARAATLAVAVRLDVYTPARFSASKAGGVAAALATAAGVPADAVATVGVAGSAAPAAAGAAVQTVYVRVAPADADAAQTAMAAAVSSGAVARAVRLAPAGLHLEAVSMAPGSGGGGGGASADAVGGLSTLAVGLIAGAVIVALVVVVLAGAAVRAQAVSVAAESDLSSSLGPLGVPAAAAGTAGAPDAILRDVYGRSSGGALGLTAAGTADAAGAHDGRFERAGSDASSTYSM